MSEEKKPLTVTFAPGCFDSLDIDQDELNELMQSIQKQFSEMTPEELEAFGKPMTEEEFNELPPEIKAQIENPGQGRNLQ